MKNPIKKVSQEYHDTAISKKSKEIASLREANEAQRRTIGEMEDVAVHWMTESKRLRSDLAAARAALDAYKSPEAAHNLAMRAIEESHRANRAEAALDGEREACDRTVGVLRSYLACDPISRVLTDSERAGVRATLSEYDALRAAEAITVPPNRTGTREESQAIADWHHDEINRRAAEAKGEPK